MKHLFKKITTLFMVFCLLILSGCNGVKKDVQREVSNAPKTKQSKIVEGNKYYSKEDVAEYIHTYKKLPSNYITKAEADKKNWSTKDKVFVIGGDRFGNREGKLPKKSGRKYFEADVQAGYSNNRGAERIIFSDDGLIFYTKDHYNSFEQLY